MEFKDTLNEEMERLNRSFGIGIIKLKGKCFEREVLFKAKKEIWI